MSGVRSSHCPQYESTPCKSAFFMFTWFRGGLKKKYFFPVIFFISLLFCFISCKVASKTELSYTNVETIKEEIAEIDKTLTWNKEIEPQRLVLNNDWFKDTVNQQIDKNI